MANPRSVALIGHYLSGKTTLLESILSITGATNRKGKVTEGNTVGDSAPEARGRQMSTEVNVATTEYLGDSLTFLDCPGSIELLQETLDAIVGVDAAVVICEPEMDKFAAVAPLMKALEDRGVPRMVFINKIDKAKGRAQDLLDALRPVSAQPLVLRHIPIRDGEEISGYVDLASERTYVYKPGAASEIVELPDESAERKAEARYQMLETLADFDDDLMEKVLEDIEPEKQEVYQNLTKDYRDGLIVPVFLGAAENDYGVRRLLKALRHEAPDPSEAAARAGVESGANVAQVLKNYYTQHGGKVSIVRVWSGHVAEGMTLNGERVSGVFRMLGHHQEKISSAAAGEVVGLGRMEGASAGDTLSEGEGVELTKAISLAPVYSLAIHANRRDDEVKLSGALAKLTDEDNGLIAEQEQAMHELVLRGQGDVHLKINLDRLENKYGIAVSSHLPGIPYKEAVRRSVQQHGRHKKQSGGHGQFGDVHLEIKPLPRGGGFEFVDKISGGVVPRQYIPAVDHGVREYLVRGPLGFPVVDLQVTLYDGQFHAVDSSEIAFKMAAQLAMREGMPKCEPVLLEPVIEVEIASPNEHTAKINAMISSRRGQILGFEMREGWQGWDLTSAHLPQSEVQNLIIELRSITQGVGSFTQRFDRLQVLSGRLADQVISARAEEKAA